MTSIVAADLEAPVGQVLTSEKERRRTLRGADLEADEAQVGQRRKLGHQAIHDLEARGPGDESTARFMKKLGLGVGVLGLGDIRRVGDDGLQRVSNALGAERSEEIALEQGDAIGHAKVGGVLAGEGEGVIAQVGRIHAAGRPEVGDGKGEAATASADVGDRGFGVRAQPGDGSLGEKLGLGAWDQDAGIDAEAEAEEPRVAEKVGQRDMASTVGEDGIGGREDIVIERTVEAERNVTERKAGEVGGKEARLGLGLVRSGGSKGRLPTTQSLVQRERTHFSVAARTS